MWETFIRTACQKVPWFLWQPKYPYYPNFSVLSLKKPINHGSPISLWQRATIVIGGNFTGGKCRNDRKWWTWLLNLLCNLYCIYYTIYKCSRGPHNTKWRVAGWRPLPFEILAYVFMVYSPTHRTPPNWNLAFTFPLKRVLRDSSLSSMCYISDYLRFLDIF